MHHFLRFTQKVFRPTPLNTDELIFAQIFSVPVFTGNDALPSGPNSLTITKWLPSVIMMLDPALLPSSIYMPLPITPINLCNHCLTSLLIFSLLTLPPTPLSRMLQESFKTRDWLLIWTDSVKCMQNLLTSINLLMPILPRLSAPFKRRLQFDPVLNLPRLAMSSIISRGYLTTAMLTEDVLLGNIWEIQEHMQYKQRGDDTSSQDIRDRGC